MLARIDVEAGAKSSRWHPLSLMTVQAGLGHSRLWLPPSQAHIKIFNPADAIAVEAKCVLQQPSMRVR